MNTIKSCAAILLLSVAACGGDAFGTGPDPVSDAGAAGPDGGAVVATDDAAGDGALPQTADAGTDTGLVGHVEPDAGEPDGGAVVVADAGAESDSAVVADAGGSHDAGPDAAPACGGASVYTHNVGVGGLTWQDCSQTSPTSPTPTAEKACSVWSTANGCTGSGCAVGPTACAGGLVAQGFCASTSLAWLPTGQVVNATSCSSVGAWN